MSLLTAILLTACGGGGSGQPGAITLPAPVPPAPTPVVPPPVLAATTIASAPQSVSAAVGASSTFSVTTTGIAPLGYQWLRNGRLIEGATGSSYTSPAAGVLDSGTVLRVIVKTAAGDLESAPAMLSVSGSGLRMFAGVEDQQSTYDPTFNRRYDTVSITIDAVGKVFGVENGKLYLYEGGRSATLMSTPNCASTIREAVADKAGNLYLVCGLAIMKMAPGQPLLGLAGAATVPGYVDGAGAAARFSDPVAIVPGPDGSVYVADQGTNRRLRRVAADGTVTTLAGGTGPIVRADGTGAEARFNAMFGVASDAQGNVYVSDHRVIRKVTPAGVVTTIAGNADEAGWVDGPVSQARFKKLSGLAVDRSGNLIIADTGNHAIRKMTPEGVVSTLAGTPHLTGATDGFGKYASFNAPEWVAIDAQGDMLVSDNGNAVLRKVSAAGNVTLHSGVPKVSRSAGPRDGLGQEARLREPQGITIDEHGNLYVADTLSYTIRRITPAGVMTTVAGTVNAFGSADGIGQLASFEYPLTVSAAGNGVLFVVDSSLAPAAINKIRRIGADGNVTTVTVPTPAPTANSAGVLGSVENTFLGADLRGHYYVATWFSLPGVCAPGAAFCAGTARWELRRIATDGTAVTLLRQEALYPGTSQTFAAMGVQLRDLAADRAGNVYLSDRENHTVLKINVAGAVSLLAGQPGKFGYADGTASTAILTYPESMSVDGAGNVYLIDGSRNMIRKITPAGVVSTLAGTHERREYVNGTLPGTLIKTHGIAAGEDGTVYFTQRNSILKIVP